MRAMGLLWDVTSMISPPRARQHAREAGLEFADGDRHDVTP